MFVDVDNFDCGVEDATVVGTLGVDAEVVNFCCVVVVVGVAVGVAVVAGAVVFCGVETVAGTCVVDAEVVNFCCVVGVLVATGFEGVDVVLEGAPKVRFGVVFGVKSSNASGGGVFGCGISSSSSSIAGGGVFGLISSSGGGDGGGPKELK